MRAVVIALAVGFDWLFGDPPNRFHPVVAMGNWLTLGRRRAPATQRFRFGAGWTLIGTVLFGLPLWLLERINVVPVLSGALLLSVVTTYRNLRRAVLEVALALEADDLAEARRLLSWHLVSRDTRELSEAEVVGAAIESLAENITDGFTAPLLAYALGGLPAAWAYRYINTSDSMWGYRNVEFEQLGKFPARLDDVVNWLPARLTGWLLVVAAWLVGERGYGAARTMLASHGETSSPNAGWTMSSMAGALGVTLTKREVYTLDGGQGQLDVDTIHRAVRVANVCVGLATVVAIGGAVVGKR